MHWMGRRGHDWSDSRQGCCENSNETSSSIEREEFLDYLRMDYLLIRNHDPWSQLVSQLVSWGVQAPKLTRFQSVSKSHCKTVCVFGPSIHPSACPFLGSVRDNNIAAMNTSTVMKTDVSKMRLSTHVAICRVAHEMSYH